MPTIKRQKPKEQGGSRQLGRPGFGVILFSIVFVYILIRVIAYVNDSDPVIFTVEQSTYDTDFTATGIAIRSETLITAGASGTPCYYVRDGEKVSKGANIFSIDSSGSVQSAIAEAQSQDGAALTSKDYSELSSQIKMFKTGFSSSGFGDLYNFKTSMDNKLLELYEDSILSNVSGNSTLSANASAAPFSGLVTYYQDNYENISINDLSAELFDKTTYSKTSLKTENQVSAGDPVCKLIDDENWQIAIALSEEEYRKVTKNTYATYTINDSGRKIQTTYDTIEKNGSYYIVVSFNKYIAQYVNERFLDINFMFSESSGLKIPESAIITKDAYMIPVDYLSAGSGDSESRYFNQLIIGEKGDTSVKQISPVIYFTDDRFCYVNPDDVASDAVFIKNDSTDTFSVATAARYTMDGVLCVSRGTAEFRRIEVIVEGDDYSIVKQGITYGISTYDRILLDGTSLKEGDTIY